jgi:RNA polymerase sigma-70 factor (ECF subfamily)
MDQRLTDAETLRRSLGEPSVFAVLYERHMARVLGYLRRRVGAELAEDLTAEVFVRAFRGRSNYGVQHDTALPWLLGIASNLIGDHRRAERRRLGVVAEMAGRAAHELQSPTEPSAALSAEVAGALKRLPVADRDALLLVVWGELSYEETARALGIPIGTVRSRIARARSKLSGGLEGLSRGRDVLIEGENHV